MTERLLEVSRDKYITGTAVVRTCIDLDKVTVFKDCEKHKDMVVVWLGDSEPVVLDMSYDEFKGRLEEYHKSKYAAPKLNFEFTGIDLNDNTIPCRHVNNLTTVNDTGGHYLRCSDCGGKVQDL